MAARHSPESRTQQKQSSAAPDEETGRSLDGDGDCRPCSPSLPDAFQRLDGEGGDGRLCSGAGMHGWSNNQTDNSTEHRGSETPARSTVVIDLTGSEAEAHAHPMFDCDSPRDFDGSEAGDEFKVYRVAKGNDVPAIDLTDRGAEEPMSGMDQTLAQEGGRLKKSESKQLHVKEGHKMDGKIYAKQRKSRLVCRECGKRFTRRETYNLHRHFHTHQDELASLTCKECGDTFRHRSSLIKHRSEHKKKGAVVRLVRRPHSREGRCLQCEHCAETFLTLGKLRCHRCQQAPEKPYRCPLCRRDFQYRVSINAHMQTHSLENPFRCLECNKGFSCGYMLRIHQRSHAALKPFECPECGMVFRHHSVMEDHRRRHKVDRPRQCRICGKRFKCVSLFHQHQFLHTGKKPFRCPMCGKAFAFTQNWRAHWRQHWKHTHDCPRCPLTFPDLAGLQTHIMSHDREQRSRVGLRTSISSTNSSGVSQHSLACPLCPLSFSESASLKTHLLTHEAREEHGGRSINNNTERQDLAHSCHQCPLTFPSLSSLQMHLVSHGTASKQGLAVLERVSTNNGEDMSLLGWPDLLNRKMLKCTECGKTFRHRSVLELHMRIHSKDKPFQCRVCGKGFKFSSYLQQHLIIHTGQKPFKCPDCGKDFAFLQNMKTHQRLHQQKPYRCTQCRKGYSEEAELQRHMLSHTGDKPHKCQLCDKSFGLAYLLRDHLNTHTGERPHRCTECHKSFPWLSSLLVHQKIHARKRQGLNQSLSMSLAPQRGRGRGRGTRGRRGSRWTSGWPRWAGGEGTEMPDHLATYPGRLPVGQEWLEKASHHTSPTFFEPQWQQQPQWQSEVGGRPVVTQQLPSGWISSPPSSQGNQVAVQYSETHSHQPDGASVWGTQALPSQKPVPLDQPGEELKQQKELQQQQQALSWTSQPPSTPGQTTVQYEEAHPRCSEGTTVWEFSTPPTVPENSSEKPGQSQQQLMGWSVSSTPTAVSQPAVQREDPHKVKDMSTWSLQAKSAQLQTLSSSDSSEVSQKQQQPFSWIGTPMSASGSKTAACYQDCQPHCGDGIATWGLQTSPVVSCAQSLLEKSANKGQQQHLVAKDYQVTPKPATPFPSAPPQIAFSLQSCYSDAFSSCMQPQNSYLTQKTALSEKHAGPRTLPTVQRSELHDPHGIHPPNSLPFSPNRLLQCMICGRTLPRELDLHIHYMQHAQGEF
ncbi:uncharacterized protein [Paramormyrops kingsleyae]|uniref:Zgc:66448 n=1 Tax=Paramormyrops kingsleyae TaxID=1676925 RepID=A0A3B3QVJ9_9TELE|nr:putative uncharacterized zinc finger protein 814 [Paramormyrops kingsleyae]